MPRRGSQGLVALAGALCALVPALALSGFTVDDALIPARYAANLAAGSGYRFNAAGAVTDGVTSLGYAFLLAPFARGGPLVALFAAKVLGVAAWTAAAAALGVAVARASDRPLRFAALGLVAASAPLAAWSGGGLETGLVTALATAAIVLRSFGRGRAGAALLGLAAALRPEMLPWAALVALAPDPDLPAPARLRAAGIEKVAVAGALPSSDRARALPRLAPAALPRLALAAAPFVVVALIRVAVFGRAAPLAAIAKPADAVLGARYAFACFLLTGPVALVAPVAFRRLSPWARWLVVATGVHFVAVALAGGDWMPLSRLVVPVLPAAALAAAHVLSVASPRVALPRLALALAGEIFVCVRVGPSAAHVMEDRGALVEELAAPLSAGKVVATVDIGWVGAATTATVVDLAGVTDPAIAVLQGGHTTKRIPRTLLDSRGVDMLVLLLADGEALKEPWTGSRFARGVEGWIASEPGIGEAFSPVAQSARSSLHYVVLRRSP